LGVNVVYSSGLVESWATQPWKCFAGVVMLECWSLVMCGGVRR
jgi:hypothetical protein